MAKGKTSWLVFSSSQTWNDRNFTKKKLRRAFFKTNPAELNLVLTTLKENQLGLNIRWLIISLKCNKYCSEVVWHTWGLVWKSSRFSFFSQSVIQITSTRGKRKDTGCFKCFLLKNSKQVTTNGEHIPKKDQEKNWIRAKHHVFKKKNYKKIYIKINSTLKMKFSGQIFPQS